MTPLSWKDLSKTERGLVRECLKARKNAYAPYSRFRVGAVAMADSGRVFRGCNVESADYTLTTHAEMSAIDAMVAAGERGLKGMVVALSSVAGPPVPCGLCRQKMREFAVRDDMEILCVGLGAGNSVREIFRATLAELLPVPFSKKNIRPGGRA